MIKVGLLGEAPHDTNAIARLLGRHFGDQIHFFPLVNNIRGSLIEEQWVKHRLRVEYQLQQPNLVVFIRDLDALEGNKAQINQRKAYFRDFSSVVDRKTILLLNIYAIEALVLADITSYNYLYGCEIELDSDPMTIEKPEVFLKTRSKYSEGKLADIFDCLQIQTIMKNCRYFKDFIDEMTILLDS